MPRYVDAIDVDALTRQTAELEAVALEQVANCEPSENPEQWNIWMAILTERTAFKYDLIDAPIVDAVEVVRCKDCKYFDHSDFGKGEEYWCKHFVSTDDYTHCHKVTEDDFCSWGERREDGNP